MLKYHCDLCGVEIIIRKEFILDLPYSKDGNEDTILRINLRIDVDDIQLKAPEGIFFSKHFVSPARLFNGLDDAEKYNEWDICADCWNLLMDNIKNNNWVLKNRE